MSGSRIVAVRKWLVEQVGDLPEFADAAVEFSWREGVDARVYVCTGEARITQEPASLKAGRTFRNETGSFDLLVRYLAPATTSVDAAVEAQELATVVEEFIADNRSPGLDGVNWLVAKGEGWMWELVLTAGVEVRRVFRVEYNARLT